MNYKYRVGIGIILTFISVLLIGISFLLEAVSFLIIGIILLVVSIVYTIFIYSIEIFIKDKELNLEELKKLGFTVIMCENCNKNNIKEDVYCIYCGEKLEIEEKIS